MQVPGIARCTLIDQLTQAFSASMSSLSHLNNVLPTLSALAQKHNLKKNKLLSLTVSNKRKSEALE